ncbi:MAG TPA: hypothetical protein VH440_08200 [Candidatus Limnocylindrales bacterium]|jgi:uncharacterized membrane protein
MAEPKRSRLYFLGFAEPGVARFVLEKVKDAVDRKEIEVADWAMITKGEGREAEITTNKKADPGAARGAGVGGLAGVVLAGISGPIGAGAIVAGAAIGSITAALKDSGIKDADLQSISHLMAAGRGGLVIAVPLDGAERFEAWMDETPEFEASDRRQFVDIVPGRTLEDAIEDYVAAGN